MSAKRALAKGGPVEDAGSAATCSFHVTSPATPLAPLPSLPSNFSGFHASLQHDFSSVLRIPQDKITAALGRVACRQCRQGLAAALTRVQQQQEGSGAPSLIIAGVPWRVSASGKSGSLMLVATAAPALETLRDLVCGGGAAPVPRALPPMPTLANLMHAVPAAARVDFLEDVKSRILTAMKSLAHARHTLRSIVECVYTPSRSAWAPMRHRALRPAPPPPRTTTTHTLPALLLPHGHSPTPPPLRHPLAGPAAAQATCTRTTPSPPCCAGWRSR